jgi:hypothetical protein
MGRALREGGGKKGKEKREILAVRNFPLFFLRFY